MQPQFSNPSIHVAAEKDLQVINTLLNSAYRGEHAKKGWTSESHLIGGEVRTDLETLLQLHHQAGSVILKYENENNEIIGCVNLQQKNGKVYLGMLSVSPLLQGGGVGKQLLKAAEEYASEANITKIYMTVISARTELIDWYKRHGYIDTGERVPFVEDGKSGNHLQPLEFMTLEKTLSH